LVDYTTIFQTKN